MKINLNDKVRVKLNEHGKHVHAQNCVALGAKISPRKADSDGWTTWQLWELMEEFGPYIHMGITSPFEGNEVQLVPANG